MVEVRYWVQEVVAFGPRRSCSQGGLTKTGNGHARRLLIEAAWHQRQPYRPTSVIIRRRWNLADRAARARGHAGNQQLNSR